MKTAVQQFGNAMLSRGCLFEYDHYNVAGGAQGTLFSHWTPTPSPLAKSFIKSPAMSCLTAPTWGFT